MLECVLWDVLVFYGKGMSYNIKFDVVCILFKNNCPGPS